MEKLRLVCLTLLLVFLQVKCFPQVSGHLSIPRASDCLVGYRVCRASLMASGKKVVWSLPKVELGEKHKKRWHYINDNPDSLCYTESSTMHYLKPVGGKLLLEGYENNLEKIAYDIPIDYLLMPMNYGDSVSGVFHGTGAYCDKLKLRTLGTYHLAADGIGSVVLPDCGDTLRNVLRVHLMQKASTRTCSSDAILKPTSSYIPDSLEAFASDSLHTAVFDNYRWYASGYRYPIIEMWTVSIAGIPASNSVAYYYPPSEQDGIASDYENEKLRDNTNEESGGEQSNETAQSLNYQFVKDTSSHTVRVVYASNAMIDVNAVLSDVSGIVIDSVQQRGQQGGEISFSYGSLRSGQYVVYLRVGMECYVEKFSVE